MAKVNKLSVIIPAYNEEKTIEKLLEKVHKADIGNIKKEIIVVDDGSRDRTVEIVSNLISKFKIKLIKHSSNKGKGTAIRTGMAYSTGDIILIQDADLEYDPDEYYSLIKPIIDNKAVVVYGSRRLKKNNTSSPPNRKSASFFFFIGGISLTFITNLLYPNLKITDESTCYKVFRSDILKNLNLKCKRFEFCAEVTAKLAKKRIKIHEVPISYYPRTKKQGKKIKGKDGFESLLVLLKYKLK